MLCILVHQTISNRLELLRRLFIQRTKLYVRSDARNKAVYCMASHPTQTNTKQPTTVWLQFDCIILLLYEYSYSSFFLFPGPVFFFYGMQVHTAAVLSTQQTEKSRVRSICQTEYHVVMQVSIIWHVLHHLYECCTPFF